MNQEIITYEDVVDLKFEFEPMEDVVYESQFGFPYEIITKRLTKKIYLEWEKETQLMKMVRIDSPKTGNIKGVIPIINLNQAKLIIGFFKDSAKN